MEGKSDRVASVPGVVSGVRVGTFRDALGRPVAGESVVIEVDSGSSSVEFSMGGVSAADAARILGRDVILNLEVPGSLL